MVLRGRVRFLVGVASLLSAQGLAPGTTQAGQGDLTPAQRIEKIKEIVLSDPALAGINREEAIYDAVSASVLKPWRQAWLRKDGAAYGRLLAKPQASVAWGTSPRQVRRDRDGVREYNWSLKQAKSASDVDSYLAGFSEVSSVRLDTFDIVSAGDKKATLDVRFDVRGTLADGTRRHDRGAMKLEVAKVGDSWKVAKIVPVQVESLEASADRKPTYEDVTASLGLGGVPIVDRGEAIRRGGYAIATADYDRDGRSDLLVGNFGPLQLLRNTPDGFVDVTAAAGIRGENLVKAAAFADLDNDGHKDLVLVRFIARDQAPPTTLDYNGKLGDADMIAYRNLGNGKFDFKGNILMRNRHYDRSMPLAIADFDGNGSLDIYIGFPGSRDFTNDLARTPETAGLARQGLWLNDGKWNFKEGPSDSGLAKENGLYPHAALATDIDSDGRTDLIVVDDSGRMNPVYRNEGKGIFRNVTHDLGLTALGWGMGASAGDYDGDGRPDLVMTNVVLSSAHRIGNIEQRLRPGQALPEGNKDRNTSMFLFRSKGDGKFEEVAKPAGLEWAGEGLATAEWIDYNHDGHLDLYVANGLWSGGEEDASSLFMRLTSARDGRDATISDPAMSRRGDGQEDPNPLLTILREFKGSIDNPGTPVSAKPTLSFGGNQPNHLYRNNGDGTFTELAFFENADRTEDGYVIAPVDIDGDGRQDLVLRNCDPAPGLSFAPVVALRNTSSDRYAVTVDVEGLKANRDGIGATVTAWVGDRRIVREVRSVTGAVQGEPVAYIGLDKGDKVDRLEVRWPSGTVESFDSVDAGRVLLREGKAIVTKKNFTPVRKDSVVISLNH